MLSDNRLPIVFLMLLVGTSSYSAGATGGAWPGRVVLPEVGVVAALEPDPPLNFSTSSWASVRALDIGTVRSKPAKG